MEFLNAVNVTTRDCALEKRRDVFGFHLSTCKNHCRIQYIHLARRKVFMICIDGELTRECISRVICIIVRELIDMICNNVGYALGKSVLIDSRKKASKSISGECQYWTNRNMFFV